jgi:hypothetical protein
MSHVDDGRLHAYLDGALESPEERLRVEDHLRSCPDCRTRLEAARDDRKGAGEILGLLGPEEVRVPPFEELLAGRGDGGGASGGWEDDPGGPSSLPPSLPAGPAASRRRSLGTSPMNRLAWAATVVLALGGGWVARGALMPDSALESRRFDLPRSADEAAEAPAPVAQAPSLGAEAPADPVLVVPETPADRPPAARLPGDPVPPAPAPAQALARAPASTPARAPAPAETPRDRAPELAEALPADRTEVAGVMGRPDADVDEGAWTPVNPAEAAVFLGRPPLELAALPWATMEVATVQGALVLRTTHPLEDGSLVELLQGPGGPAMVPGLSTLTARREGLDLVLRGPVEPEILEDLLRRIR